MVRPPWEPEIAARPGRGAAALRRAPGADRRGTSVQIFYMISGFLITHVLLSKPVYQRYGTFLKSRWVRIYPIYAVVALVSWASLHLLTSTGMPGWDSLPLQAKLLLMISNLLILGQDWVMFLTADEHGLVFTANFWKSSPKLYTYLLVQQAWSLGVELTFYLLAPFIVRRKSWVIGLLVAALALRVVLLKMVVGWSDPWSYRFFQPSWRCFCWAALRGIGCCRCGVACPSGAARCPWPWARPSCSSPAWVLGASPGPTGSKGRC